jgi:hypothetical protein
VRAQEEFASAIDTAPPAPAIPAIHFVQLSGRVPPGRDRDLDIIPRRDTMRVDLDVLVDGRPLPTIRHAGRTYVPVPRLGIEYTIRVWNHGPRRITAIVSVDGLSVINGRPASETHPGYIVAPGTAIEIKGWRRDVDTVAAFRFEEREKSYAARMGRPENIGVIGLVAFEEMGWLPRPRLEQKDAVAPKGRMAVGGVGGTGTGYGRDLDSRVYEVPFVRSTNKRAITLYYDTTDALREAGVPMDRPIPVPFPGDTEFVPPPPGRLEK